MILLLLSLKWRFDNKGIVSDQNILKRKIKEALKSTEGRNIIESLTSSGSEAPRIRSYFYKIDLNTNLPSINNKAIDDWVDLNFNKIFAY